MTIPDTTADELVGPLTDRVKDALVVLAQDPSRDWSPAGFAAKFWPEKNWQRGNGPWGLGPDASGRHGGRMLTRLHRLQLVDLSYQPGIWTARLNTLGAEIAKRVEADRTTKGEDS